LIYLKQNKEEREKNPPAPDLKKKKGSNCFLLCANQKKRIRARGKKTVRRGVSPYEKRGGALLALGAGKRRQLLGGRKVYSVNSLPGGKGSCEPF